MNRYLVLTAASLLSFAAFAQQAPSDTEKAMTPSFESLDQDADRQLTQSEAKADAGLARNFKAVDKNGDGYISRDEFNSFHKG